MKTIVEGRNNIVKIWGKQAVRKTSYRLMHYTVLAEHENEVFVLNAITGELIQLDNVEKSILKADSIIPDESMKELIVHHFLVPVDYDEKEVLYHLRSILKRIVCNQSITSYTILPTTGCNARCFYCYESDFPHEIMNVDTAAAIVNYIVNHCGEQKGVHLHWFGGEPMLASERIDQICKGLQENGITFKSRMTSNASLFSKDMAKHAREQWHLHEIQITLDGTELVYNASKSYSGFCGNPYKTVLENIGFLLDQNIHVIIRLNLGLHNLLDLSRLIQEIGLLYSSYSNLTVYVGILFNNMGFEKVQYSECELEKLELAKRELKHAIKETGIKYGDKTNLPYLKTTHCMADNPGTVLISPSGGLGKCEHAVFEKLIGNVFSGTLDEICLRKWEMIHNWPECEKCCLYPDCVMLENCETLKPCHRVALEDRIHEVRAKMIEEFQYNRSQ